MRQFQTVLLAIALGFMSGLPSLGEVPGRSASLADAVVDVNAYIRGRVSFAEFPAGLYVFGVSLPGHVPHAGIVLLLAEYPAAPRVHQVVTLKESP